VRLDAALVPHARVVGNEGHPVLTGEFPPPWQGVGHDAGEVRSEAAGVVQVPIVPLQPELHIVRARSGQKLADVLLGGLEVTREVQPEEGLPTTNRPRIRDRQGAS